MKKLFLIRHGESEWNVLKRVQGQKDTKLTIKGKNQAKLLSKKLEQYSIDSIYSSDLIRAKETARVIGEKIKKTVVLKKELREMNFGSWEGLTNNIIQDKYKEDVSKWREHPDKFKFENGESLHSLKLRVAKVIKDIVESDKGKNIVIVSHSAAIKTMILSLLDFDLLHYKNLSLDNTSISVIEYRTYNKVLKLYNDTSHLKEGM